METVKERKKSEVFLIAVFVVFTLVSIYCRLFYGWDQDESYNILLAQRIADGKILFKDMWDLHQTAAVFPAVFCRIYVGVFNSTDGIAVFLRGMSVLLQLAVSAYTFVVIKKYYGEKCAFGGAVVVANMLPRATQETEYSTVAIWGCLICSLLLFEIKRNKGNYTRLAIAAFFYAMAVYSYPTLIITVPFMAVLILLIVADNKKKGITYLLAFFGICAACAIILFAYLFSKMSVSEFLSIIGELGKNDDHIVYFKGFWPVYAYKSIVRIAVTMVIAIIVKLILKAMLKIDVNAVFLYILYTTLMIVVLNITGLRPSGPFGFLERYLGTLILAGFIGIEKEDHDFAWILGGTGIAVFCGVIMGSNLGINENAMFLELTIIFMVVLCIKKLEKIREKERLISELAICTFLLGIAFSSGYFVRIDSTQPANIFQCTGKMSDGPLAGISVFPELKERYDVQSSSVRAITENGKLYTLLTKDAIFYYDVQGDYTSAQYAATGQYYNEQWVDFYTKFEGRVPDEFLIDKYNYPELAIIEKDVFGKWLLSEYSIDEQRSDDSFFVMTRNNG